MSEFKEPFPKLNKKRSRILAARILGRSVVYAFAIFGILFILLLVAVLGILKQEVGILKTIPDESVLTLDFDSSAKETRGDNLLTEISESSPLSFYDLVKAVNMAALDPKIKALVAEISVSDLGLAQIQDMRKVIKDFRATGKKAYLFSRGFGSLGGGTSEYYLATAFDEIWMQPNSEAGITGIGIEIPFVRNLLDKVGATPEFFTRYEYKNAFASMTSAEMSPQYRAEMEKLSKGIFEQVLGGAALDRNISPVKLRELVNQAPLSAEEALAAGLIDKIGFRSQLLDEVKGKPLSVEDYNTATQEGRRHFPTIAFLAVEGVIDEGYSTGNPLKGEIVTGARTVAEQIEEISKNKDVKALILRINSPGGSYNASNEIWYALERLKTEKNIPVIVSMGDYAASGGYFIALGGDVVLAEPATLTGSIGVLGGKIVLNGLWEKLGVNWQDIYEGQNAGIMSMNHPFSESEKTAFNKSLDRIYEDFTLKVSKARNINLKDMDMIARGRIWLGNQALQIGLVDGLGGIDAAITIAKEKGGIKAGEKFTFVYYPKTKTLQEKISEVIGGSRKVVLNELKSEMGLDNMKINVLKRWQYDLALRPFELKM